MVGGGAFFTRSLETKKGVREAAHQNVYGSIWQTARDGDLKRTRLRGASFRSKRSSSSYYYLLLCSLALPAVTESFPTVSAAMTSCSGVHESSVIILLSGFAQHLFSLVTSTTSFDFVR